ncbi:MAG: hypothetical protein LBI18_08020 [Planctomycetaceae bacterium]|nr:hypothetical protein [Planctomycetaceae bacterium]
MGDVSKKVGDVSPKHHVGVSRPAPVFGQQFVLPNGFGIQLPSDKGQNCLTAMQPFGERLPT